MMVRNSNSTPSPSSTGSSSSDDSAAISDAPLSPLPYITPSKVRIVAETLFEPTSCDADGKGAIDDAEWQLFERAVRLAKWYVDDANECERARVEEALALR